MKERPILFSGEMVRAILAGKKTQTRRVIKSQPEKIIAHLGGCAVIDRKKKVFCPYGQPGDRLWVREAWQLAIPLGESVRAERVPHYKADGVVMPRWKPSIHMPRKFSRLTLEVVSVRVEHVQDITEADAQAEGWDMSNLDPMLTYDPVWMTYAVLWFQKVWDSINSKRGFGWDVNPWVWVIGFKQVEQPA